MIVALVEEIVEREIAHFGGRETIEVHVLQREPWAPIFLHDRKGGGADLARLDAEAFGETAHEGGLARAEIAVEQHGCPWREAWRQGASGGDGLLLARRDGCLCGHLRNSANL